MKNFKKLVAIMVIAIMVLSAIPFTASAATSTWTGGVATAFGGGTGTEADPYQITSADELAFLASSTNGGKDYKDVYFKLTVDVNLNNAAWTPIGFDKAKAFKGSFDGNGCTISGLNADTTNEWSGLFGYTIGATISNLNVQGSKVVSTKYSGGIVGLASAGTYIINCTSNVTAITVTADASGAGIGGIVGRVQDLGERGDNAIIGCVNYGPVGVSNANEYHDGSVYVGGIVGVGGGVSVMYCSNYGTVISAPAKAIMVGGIMGCQGASDYRASVLYCATSGEVIAYTSDATTEAYAGGLIGRASHVTFGTIAGSICTGKTNIYKNLTTEKAAFTAGTLVGHARKATIVFDCYLVEKGTVVGYNDSGMDDVTTITYADDYQLKGMDVFTVVKSGTTVNDAMDVIVSSLMSALSTYKQSVLDQMAEYTNGKTVEEYCKDKIVETLGIDVSATVWEADIFGDFPYLANADAALTYVNAKEMGNILTGTLKELKELIPVETKPETETESESEKEPTEETEPTPGTNKETEPEKTPETTPTTQEPKGCKGAVVSGIAVIVMAAACAVALKKR